MKKISIKGVIIGAGADILSTNIFAIPLLLYITVSHHLTTLPKEQFSQALMQILRDDPVLFSVQILSGSLCSILGGYVAARIAKKNEIINGALASFLCVGSGLYALFFGHTSIPIWQHVLGFILSPVLSAFGGFVCLKTKQVTT